MFIRNNKDTHIFPQKIKKGIESKTRKEVPMEKIITVLADLSSERATIFVDNTEHAIRIVVENEKVIFRLA